MIRVRKAEDRGYADHGWLKTRHSFSFAGYYDPDYTGFRALRVLNDDRVAAGAGFPTHPHRDMEILSFVVEGALEHRDSIGNGSVIRAGDVQRVSAGTGVTHSEFNPSDEERLRFLQVWIVPDRRGHEPGYDQKRFDPADAPGRLRLVASPRGDDGSLTLNQDVRVWSGRLGENDAFDHALGDGRHAWLQVVSGSVRLGDTGLDEGDGVAISEESSLRIEGTKVGGDVLLFDLA